jgi:uncharacterized membrane protein
MPTPMFESAPTRARCRQLVTEDAMSTLTVWKFDTAEGAAAAEQTLERLANQALIVIHDAATVSWEEGKSKPKTRQSRSLTGAGALGGAFWGFFFGLIFFMPLLGMAIGAASGALSGSLADVGIDDDFIKSVRSKVTPGTSALFLLSSNAVLDKIQAEMSGHRPELIQTNLSDADEDRLREAFGD